jgi:hypothetical protein
MDEGKSWAIINNIFAVSLRPFKFSPHVEFSAAH